MAEETKDKPVDLNKLAEEVKSKLRERGVNIDIINIESIDRLDDLLKAQNKHVRGECNCLRERFDKQYTDPQTLARMAHEIAHDLRPTTTVSRMKMAAIVEALAAGGVLQEDPWCDWVRDMFGAKTLHNFAESTWSIICNMMEGRHGKFSTDEIVKFIQACLISGALAFLYDHIRGSKSEEQVNEEFQSILEYIRRNSKKEKPN